MYALPSKMEQIVSLHHCSFPYNTKINIQFDVQYLNLNKQDRGKKNNTRFQFSEIKGGCVREKPLLSHIHDVH